MDKDTEKEKDFGELIILLAGERAEELYLFWDKWREEKVAKEVKGCTKSDKEMAHIHYSAEIAFVTGFIYGQMFEVCDKEIAGRVVGLTWKLIEEGILKYQPKGKKDHPQGALSAAEAILESDSPEAEALGQIILDFYSYQKTRKAGPAEKKEKGNGR